jgi:hypothetical protein
VVLPTGFEVTSFLTVPDTGVFYLGSRQGALACYQISSAKLLGIWRRVHDHESIRSIKLHRHVTTPKRSTEVRTTGRDWAWQILKITIPEQVDKSLLANVVDGTIDGVEMQCMHQSNLNRGWLEGV